LASAAYPAAIERIKERTPTFLGLGDAATVSVSELACRNPGCQDVETIVAVLAADEKTRTARFHKPIPNLGDDELTEGLRAFV